MTLSYSQIKEITLGALDVIQKENGDIIFKRFTERQTNFYRESFENFYTSSLNTAGVRLSFSTDATLIKMHYSIMKGGSASWLQFDVVCDGAIIQHTDLSSLGDSCEETLECPLPDGEHIITIHFPNKAIFSLKNLELADADFVRPHIAKGPKILFLGDSITHGASTVYPSLTYTARLTAMTDAVALNQGIGGEIFREDILDPELPFNPDLITIAFGTNDWSGARNNSGLRKSRADAYFRKIKKIFPNAKITYISPLWRGISEEENETFLLARKEFEEIARSLGIAVIDGMNLVPHLPEFYQDKTLHPNALGFSLYAENLAVELKKLGYI